MKTYYVLGALFLALFLAALTGCSSAGVRETVVETTAQFERPRPALPTSVAPVELSEIEWVVITRENALTLIPAGGYLVALTPRGFEDDLLNQSQIADRVLRLRVLLDAYLEYYSRPVERDQLPSPGLKITWPF